MYKSNQLKSWAFVLLISSSFASFAQASGQTFTLEQAQAFALENSYMSLNAQREITKSQKKVNETIGTGLPQVSATGNYQRYIQTPLSLIPASAFGGPEGEFAEVFLGTEQQMGLGLRAEQLIFDGSYFVGLQAAKVYLELSKNDLKRSDMEVKQMVTIAYGNVLVAQRNSEILADNVESLKKSAFETEELYKNGFIEEQDKDQIQLTLANVQNSYNNAVRMIEISKNQLKFTMGINVESGIELADDLVTVTKASTSEAYLSNEFNPSNHVEFQIINTQKTATELLLKQQKSTALPRLSAFYNFSSNSFANEFDFLDNKRFYNGQLIGLNLNVPMFSGLSRYNRIQQAEIDVEKIETTKTQVEQQLILEAQNAKSEYTFTLSQYNTTESNMELAQSIYTKTKVKYEEGISSSIELTTANNQLLESQANFINAAFQLIQAKANLDKALNQ